MEHVKFDNRATNDAEDATNGTMDYFANMIENAAKELKAEADAENEATNTAENEQMTHETVTDEQKKYLKSYAKTVFNKVTNNEELTADDRFKLRVAAEMNRRVENGEANDTKYAYYKVYHQIRKQEEEEKLSNEMEAAIEAELTDFTLPDDTGAELDSDIEQALTQNLSGLQLDAMGAPIDSVEIDEEAFEAALKDAVKDISDKKKEPVNTLPVPAFITQAARETVAERAETQTRGQHRRFSFLNMAASVFAIAAPTLIALGLAFGSLNTSDKNSVTEYLSDAGNSISSTVEQARADMGGSIAGIRDAVKAYFESDDTAVDTEVAEANGPRKVQTITITPDDVDANGNTVLPSRFTEQAEAAPVEVQQEEPAASSVFNSNIDGLLGVTADIINDATLDETLDTAAVQDEIAFYLGQIAQNDLTPEQTAKINDLAKQAGIQLEGSEEPAPVAVADAEPVENVQTEGQFADVTSDDVAETLDLNDNTETAAVPAVTEPVTHDTETAAVDEAAAPVETTETTTVEQSDVNVSAVSVEDTTVTATPVTVGNAVDSLRAYFTDQGKAVPQQIETYLAKATATKGIVGNLEAFNQMGVYDAYRVLPQYAKGDDAHSLTMNAFNALSTNGTGKAQRLAADALDSQEWMASRFNVKLPTPTRG